MTITQWQPVKTIWCDRIKDTASLIEQRVYLGDSLAAISGLDQRVQHRECSHATACNLAGCPCRWSYLNAEYDPYA